MFNYDTISLFININILVKANYINRIDHLRPVRRIYKYIGDINNAIINDHFESLKLMQIKTDCSEVAVTHRNLKILKWLHRIGPIDKGAHKALNIYNSEHILNWIHSTGYYYTKVRYRDIEATKWFLDRYPECVGEFAECAVWHDKTDQLIYICLNYDFLDIYDILKETHGVDILIAILKHKRTAINQKIIDRYIKKGKLYELTLIDKYIKICTYENVCFAIKNNQPEIVDYMIFKNHDLDIDDIINYSINTPMYDKLCNY